MNTKQEDMISLVSCCMLLLQYLSIRLETYYYHYIVYRKTGQLRIYHLWHTMECCICGLLMLDLREQLRLSKALGPIIWSSACCYINKLIDVFLVDSPTITRKHNELFLFENNCLWKGGRNKAYVIFSLVQLTTISRSFEILLDGQTNMVFFC